MLAARRALAAAQSSGPPLSGLDAWYDASKLTGLANGDSLAAWPDLSGNGHNLDTPGAPAPTYQLVGINGLPCVNFNGSRIFGGTAFQTAITVTCAGVIQAGAGTQGIIGTGSGDWMLALDAGSWKMRASGFANVLAHAVTAQTSPHSFIIQFDLSAQPSSNTWSMYIDGVEVATASEVSSTATTHTVYALGQASLYGVYTGLFAEALIYSQILSPGQIAQLYNYLKTKWATP